MTTIEPADTEHFSPGRRRALGAVRLLMLQLRVLFNGSQISAERLERQLKDFTSGGLALIPQRQVMYFAAGALAAGYYDVRAAIIFFALLQISEFIDNAISRKVIAWPGGNLREARTYERLLFLSSAFSAVTVASFTSTVSWIEGPVPHFTPLFFLFAAGLFAAVKNHQLPSVLYIRLEIYGAAFILIPIRDILRVRPGVGSELWLELATVVFVLFFVVESSILFLKLYRKNLDQIDELRAEHEVVKAAMEVKSQFVAVVSHELRTPLTSIHGSLGIIRSGVLQDRPERLKDVIEVAYKNSARLSDLINDLLDLQKMESGQMGFAFDTLNVTDLVRESLALNETYAHRCEVTLRMSAESRDVYVTGDAGRLKQLMANLLSNAIKFSKPGGEVAVMVRPGQGTVTISVQDHGIGIPPNSRELVFGKFTQVDATARRAFQGTGLGMHISERIVRAHGGSIDYVSVLGVGTTFSVELDTIEPPVGAA